jgi:hypothetical protein
MSRRDVSSVPKFGSFKKKPEPPAVSEKDRDDEKRRQGDSSRSGGKDASADHRYGSPAAVSVQTVKTQDSSYKRTTGGKFDISQRPALPRSTYDELFAIDKQGDPLISRYGCNDRYAVPAYRRFGNGRLLGSDAYYGIDRSGNRDEFFLRSYGDGGSHLSRDRKSALARAGIKGTNLVRVRPDRSSIFSGTEDFLPLKQSRKRKRSFGSSDESPHQERQSYRSIYGMSKKHENSDSDEVYSSDSSLESNPPVFTDPLQKKNIELTARVKVHPEDVGAWLELVEHQDVLRDLNSPDGRHATSAEIKSYADIKLSMLERALKHCKAPEQACDLRLRIMLEGVKIWDVRTTDQRWKDLVADHGTNLDIWTAYMTFKQANLLTFTYDHIKFLYVDKLLAVKADLAKKVSESSKRSLYDQLVIVFTKATQFIADAGYAELAVAAWQAILELHFCCPTSLADGPLDQVFASLQSFWESEIPRIGDEGAKGWAAFESTTETQDAPEPKSYGYAIPPTTRDPYKAWAAVEKQKSTYSKIPARTMDDGTEDDPYRVIMYADIEDLLFFVPANLLPLVQGQLLDAFLNFCQLPPAFGTSTVSQAILRDQTMNCSSGVYLDCETKSKGGASELYDTAIPQFTYQIQTLRKTPEVLFPTAKWFRYIQPYSAALLPEQQHFVSRALKALVLSSRDAEFALYYLSFDSINNVGSSKKLAKTLLKHHPSQISLYIGFARSEFSKGSKDAARKVLSAASGLPGLSLHNRLRLYVCWAWMELEDGYHTQALARLCEASGQHVVDDSPTAAQVLSTSQHLTGNRDQLLSSREVYETVTYCEAMVLLEYTTKRSGKEPQSVTQGDIWSALSIVTACSKAFASRGFAESTAHEWLLQFAAQLLYYHACHGYVLFAPPNCSKPRLTFPWAVPIDQDSSAKASSNAFDSSQAILSSCPS